MADIEDDEGRKRDEGGRFVVGTRGGPGRPPTARHRAFEDAVSQEDLERLWQAEVSAADGGDADARRFLLKTGMGRLRERPPAVPALDWPRLDSPEALQEALAVTFEAHAAGVLDADALRWLVGVLREAAGVLEVVKLEARVVALEAAVEAVEAEHG